jgi:tetratricopeptide (TPR) repeat protein
MAEWYDKNGEFAGWVSDDPDDWNSFSDYERRIRNMVMKYNEEAFVLGEHLLGFDLYKVLDMISLLSRINVNYVHDHGLQERLKCIRKWAIWRVCSCHPDNIDEKEVQLAEDSFTKADEMWKKGKTEKAIELYERAGLYGHPWAYERLGYYYEEGVGGLTQDINKAIEYYKKGDDDDLRDCTFKLGLIYFEGRKEVTPNPTEAYKWIRRAAILGACNAGNVLGECFENGWGCEKNLRKALYWYDVSQTGIENGDNLEIC